MIQLNQNKKYCDISSCLYNIIDSFQKNNDIKIVVESKKIKAVKQVMNNLGNRTLIYGILNIL